MLVIRIDEEIEGQLADILAHEKDTKHGELIKRLIRDPWLTLQLGKSIVERRGGHPQHLLRSC